VLGGGRAGVAGEVLGRAVVAVGPVEGAVQRRRREVRRAAAEPVVGVGVVGAEVEAVEGVEAEAEVAVELEEVQVRLHLGDPALLLPLLRCRLCRRLIPGRRLQLVLQLGLQLRLHLGLQLALQLRLQLLQLVRPGGCSPRRPRGLRRRLADRGRQGRGRLRGHRWRILL
ncbi:MAG: hypothetical protein ACK559_38480, partial [bacterium]